MSVDVDVKTIRARTVTASLLASRTTEQHIINLLAKWDKGIKGSGYILHDKDIYTEGEAKRINAVHKKAIEAIKEHRSEYATQADFDKAIEAEQSKLVKAGEPKEPHWHIVLDFGTNAKSFADIAGYLNCEVNMIMKLRGRKNDTQGFIGMMAYLTHITDAARLDNKYEYPYSEVKGFRLPDEAAFKDIDCYEEFAEAYIAKNLSTDSYTVAIMKGKLTPKELKEKEPQYYIDHIAKIVRARLEYVNSLPTPRILINFYVGPYNSEHDAGRIGKSLVSQVLAVAHLKLMFPDIDFESMTFDDLESYVFHAGGSGVTLDGYDGQPIIIWDDVRAYQLIKSFDGISNLFNGLDSHPKPVNFNVKYGKVRLKNRINIFNGMETYDEFTDNLSKEWREYKSDTGFRSANFEVREDKAQAVGRFPGFITVSPDFITAEMSLQYLIGTTYYDFKYTFKNNLQAVAQHGLLYHDTDWIGKPYTDAEKIIEELPNKLELPDILFAPVDLDKEYELFKTLYHALFPYSAELTIDEWRNYGAPNFFDINSRRFCKSDYFDVINDSTELLEAKMNDLIDSLIKQWHYEPQKRS